MGRMKELLYVTSGEAQFDEADKGEPLIDSDVVSDAEFDRSISPPPEQGAAPRRSQSA
jgi:hypothetical protein